jgi:hypothetical protein
MLIRVRSPQTSGSCGSASANVQFGGIDFVIVAIALNSFAQEVETKREPAAQFFGVQKQPAMEAICKPRDRM